MAQEQTFDDWLKLVSQRQIEEKQRLETNIANGDALLKKYLTELHGPNTPSGLQRLDMARLLQMKDTVELTIHLRMMDKTTMHQNDNHSIVIGEDVVPGYTQFEGYFEWKSQKIDESISRCEAFLRHLNTKIERLRYDVSTESKSARKAKKLIEQINSFSDLLNEPKSLDSYISAIYAFQSKTKKCVLNENKEYQDIKGNISILLAWWDALWFLKKVKRRDVSDENLVMLLSKLFPGFSCEESMIRKETSTRTEYNSVFQQLII